MASFTNENRDMRSFSIIEVRTENLCKIHCEDLLNKLNDSPILKGKAIFDKYGQSSIIANLIFSANFGYKFSFKIEFSPDIYLYLYKIKENKNPYFIKCTLVDFTDISLPHSSLTDDVDLFFDKSDDLITKIVEIRKELMNKNSLDSKL